MDWYEIARIIALVIIWICIPVNLWALKNSRRIWKDGREYRLKGIEFLELAEKVYDELTKDKELYEEWRKTRNLPENTIPVENDLLTSEENERV